MNAAEKRSDFGAVIEIAIAELRREILRALKDGRVARVDLGRFVGIRAETEHGGVLAIIVARIDENASLRGASPRIIEVRIERD